MQKNNVFYKNKLGLRGWLSGGRYGIERYAYTLHRITGLGLLVYFVMHIIVTGSRINGPEGWQIYMESFKTPLFKFGEFLVFVAFAFHAVNGIRLAMTELGLFLGKPTRPIYPYKSSVMRQRPLLIVVMIVAAVVVVLGGIDFYVLGK